MNNKIDILNAWIVVEKLAEGVIDPREECMRTFDKNEKDWEKKFHDFIAKYQREEKIDKEDIPQTGIALYLDIFNFDEVTEILKKSYAIPDYYQENYSSNKFTVAVYFDYRLDFQQKNFFYTMSGYIRKHEKFPVNIVEEEAHLCSEIREQFLEYDFNTAIKWLFQKYNVNRNNFRYKFIKNLELDDINLHSFFVSDLEQAKGIKTDNLERYFSNKTEGRINLESRKESTRFNPKNLKRILQPDYYPMGRFPENSDYALSFMQQVATNIAINENESILSVNGPPGTGKTTLLKDIFSHMIVKQAFKICNLPDQHIPETLNYWDQAKIGILPEDIAKENIVVASSNNSAIQNIVCELPLKEKISPEFLSELLQADYFTDISNTEQLEQNSKKKNEKHWGVFSMQAGTSFNLGKIRWTIDQMVKELEEEAYVPNPNIYNNFLALYNEVKSVKDKYQQYYNQLKYCRDLKHSYYKFRKRYECQRSIKKQKIEVITEIIKKEKQKLEQEKNSIREQLNGIILNFNNITESMKQEEKKYEVMKEQCPMLFWIHKVFNTDTFKEYFRSLNQIIDRLNMLVVQKKELSENKKYFENLLERNEQEIFELEKNQQDENVKFEKWKKDKRKQLQEKEREIKKLESIESIKSVRSVDFSKSYQELQMSNPWFDKTFRVKQTELFIAAMKVKKQFLYDNRKNLKKAKTIWSLQQDYSLKEHKGFIQNVAWQWINLAIPVISTTFASFRRMFYNMPENSIQNLFIDEAGQALPQACVGAMFRCKRIMAFGDPAQIKPVLTVNTEVLNLIARHHGVSEKYVSEYTSVQTILDSIGTYGFYKNEEEWIGIPLWVHRRCDDPMFSISNAISYKGLMVQGKPEYKAYGKAFWYDIGGKANEKFVREQIEFLIQLIEERLKEDPSLKREIYVISPFRNVAYQAAKALDRIEFTKWKMNKPVNVGTVHTFQGKEAKIVYFILGADNASKGAAAWAVSESNIMNVAATRAKEEFYIIGDKKLYSSLASKVVYKTIQIIDNYQCQKDGESTVLTEEKLRL